MNDDWRMNVIATEEFLLINAEQIISSDNVVIIFLTLKVLPKQYFMNLLI